MEKEADVNSALEPGPVRVARFEQDLRDLMGVALRGPPSSDGPDANDIDELQERLRFALPDPLRKFYMIAGGYPEVMTSYHQFLMPGAVRLESDGLVFCEARGSKLLWSVLQSQGATQDPPVMQREPAGGEWCEESYSLCVFLINMACWQLISSMPAVVRLGVSFAVQGRMKKRMTVVSATMKYGMASLLDKDAGVLASMLYDYGDVFVGGQDPVALERYAGQFGGKLEWRRD